MRVDEGQVYVAHLLWEQDVAGSNPVAPTIKIKGVKRLLGDFEVMLLSEGDLYRLSGSAPNTWLLWLRSTLAFDLIPARKRVIQAVNGRNQRRHEGLA